MIGLVTIWVCKKGLLTLGSSSPEEVLGIVVRLAIAYQIKLAVHLRSAHEMEQTSYWPFV